MEFFDRLGLSADSLGPFAPFIQLASFLLAAAVGLVVLLWGKGLSPQGLPAGGNTLFRVAVGVIMAAALALALAFSGAVPKEGLVYWLSGLIAIMVVSFLLSLMVRPAAPAIGQAGVRQFALSAVAVLSSSLSLLFATLLVERTTLASLPTAAVLAGGGAPGMGSAVVLRGVEAEQVVIVLDGFEEWQPSDPSPSGTVDIEIVVTIGSTSKSLAIAAVLPPGGAGQVFTTQFAKLDVPADQRAPGRGIYVAATVKSCKYNTPHPSDPPPGQSGNCSFKYKVEAKPV